MKRSYSWNSNFGIGTCNFLFRLFACLVCQYALFRIRLKSAGRREGIRGPETHLLKIYAFLIAPLTAHKPGKPRRVLGPEQTYFRVTFKLKERNPHTCEHSKRIPILLNCGYFSLKNKHILLKSEISDKFIKRAEIFRPCGYSKRASLRETPISYSSWQLHNCRDLCFQCNLTSEDASHSAEMGKNNKELVGITSFLELHPFLSKTQKNLQKVFNRYLDSIETNASWKSKERWRSKIHEWLFKALSLYFAQQ